MKLSGNINETPSIDEVELSKEIQRNFYKFKNANIERLEKFKNCIYKELDKPDIDYEYAIQILQIYCIEKKNDLLLDKIQEDKAYKLVEYINFHSNLRETLCVVCSERKRNTLFLPCKHIVICTECSTLLNECPTCKHVVESKIDDISI